MLFLHITDYQSETRWRWALYNARHKLLAEHEVALDAHDPQYKNFIDIPRRLESYAPLVEGEAGETGLARRRQWMHDLGEWTGEKIFGALRAALRAGVVQVVLPRTAQGLLSCPFEMAHLDGKPLAAAGVRLVYVLEGQTSPTEKPVPRDTLRVLHILSLPDEAAALDLREQRYQLKRRLEELAQTKGLALQVRTLQYGATRLTLQTALEDIESWDIIHVSGHGLTSELVLEQEDGAPDYLPAAEFLELLKTMDRPPQLVMLSACYSMDALHAERARGLADQPAEAAGPEQKSAADPQAATQFPGLAQAVAEALDCAVLAMRYAVSDEFSVALLLGLFDRLLDKKCPLPEALQLALGEALEKIPAAPETSAITPLLFGRRAADLRFKPPARKPDFALPDTRLGLAFPAEPERFVGRLLPLSRASQALAPGSEQSGVLFHGMAGGGKTACALELAYRHERDRFAGYLWFKAPDEDQPYAPGSVSTDFLLEMERQLDLRELELTTYAGWLYEFEYRTVPRLKNMLQQNAVLVVIDNIESLLTESGEWRDPMWGMLIEQVLLAHGGLSRVVLTSRRLPAALQDHPRLLREVIPALNWGESARLGRALPNLRQLAEAAATRDLWFRALDMTQGHPKLLELADKLAADPAQLRLKAEAIQSARWDEAKARRFFVSGESDYTEADFSATLRRWVEDLATRLSSAARLLLFFLARLETADLNSQIMEANWPQFIERLAQQDRKNLSGFSNLTGLAQDLPTALASLTACGLLESCPITQSPDNLVTPGTGFFIHPTIAETARALAPAAVLVAVDGELGDYWRALRRRSLKTKIQDGKLLAAEGGKHAVPYLLRAKRWKETSALLEDLIQRDTNPATLAFALPALRQVAAATVGAKRELTDAGALVGALVMARHYPEAEQMGRDLITRSVAQGNYRLASEHAGNIINMLRMLNRAEEALPLTGLKADYTRQAGLGPWTQLGDECQRIQLLNALGRYAEVLVEVERLRPRFSELPDQGEADELVAPWSVRETLLSTGADAAIRSGEWQMELALNAEVYRYKEDRAVDELELARTRYNDAGSYLQLGRLTPARGVLRNCRLAFEKANDVPYLSKVYSALAYLEDEEATAIGASGNPESVRCEEIALRYSYQIGDPDDCAISHANLANYLERLDQSSALALNQRLAAALIWLQIGSDNLPSLVSMLADSPLPPQPPAFASVVETVEQIEGVRFWALFNRLPARAQDGEAAIATVWDKVLREKTAQETAQMPEAVRNAVEARDAAAFNAALQALPPEQAQAIVDQLRAAGIIGGAALDAETILAQMPEAVQQAIKAEDVPALTAALAALPPEQAQAVEAQLREAGIIGGESAGPGMDEVLSRWDTLLHGIAAVAVGDNTPRAQLEELLPDLEQRGWQLMGPVMQLWRGERDAAVLTEGIDPNSARLVQRILEYITADSPPAEQ